jgi:ribulose-5-phosphate 4-epimerase/fuculose-1-phosphate aldolase
MNQSGAREGVVKYACEHVRRPLGVCPDLAGLLEWRARLFARRLIGADDAGFGYGNLSLRLYASPRFLISGTQTSGLAEVDASHFAEVTVVDLDRNFLRCVGPSPASSEALTHAALYAADPEVRGIVHAHSRPIWERHRHRLPTTRDDVEYGTPQMAHEVIRLYRRGPVGHQGVIIMGGHPDGVIAYGASLEQAARAILALDAVTPLPPRAA